MPLLTYPDAYLAKFCTTEREDRAFSDVDTAGTFAAEWRNRLATLRCYIIACLENQSAPDDLFTAKLKSYRAEYDALLAQAKAATPDAVTGLPATSFSVALDRG
jgi:hypothetical protein